MGLRERCPELSLFFRGNLCFLFLWATVVGIVCLGGGQSRRIPLSENNHSNETVCVEPALFSQVFTTRKEGLEWSPKYVEHSKSIWSHSSLVLWGNGSALLKERYSGCLYGEYGRIFFFQELIWHEVYWYFEKDMIILYVWACLHVHVCTMCM